MDLTNFQEIDKSTTLYPGDVVAIKFKFPSSWLYIKAAHLALIDSELAKHKEYKILSYNTTSESGYVFYKVEIIAPDDKPEVYEAGVVTAQVLIALFVSVALIVFSLSFVSVAKQITKYGQTPAGEADIKSNAALKAGIGNSIPILATACVLGTLYFLYRSRR